MNTKNRNVLVGLAGLITVLGLVSGCSWDVSESRLKDSEQRYGTPSETEAEVSNIADPVVAAGDSGAEASNSEIADSGIEPANFPESIEVPHGGPGEKTDSAAPYAPEIPEIKEGAAIASFTVTPGASDTLPVGFYEVSWEIKGAKTAYVYGDLLNRLDSDLVPLAVPGKYKMRCGLVDGRFLVTYGDGSDIPYAPNGPQVKGYALNEPFLKGVDCDNSNEGSGDDCGDDSEETAPHDRDCRIDLVNPGLSLTTGKFFTRNYLSKSRLCLVVIGDDGVTKTECRGHAAGL